MSSSAIDRRPVAEGLSVNRHKLRLRLAIAVMIVAAAGVFAFGLDYYGLSLADRVSSPKHAWLRPSGVIGLRLGMVGAALFVALYTYPLRKKWRWLGQFGKTRNWLDFHVLFGIAAPAAITFHSSFKFQGLAGIAYWLMIAVMASGVAGRYIYAKIPRRQNSAELSLRELEESQEELTAQLARQRSLTPAEIEAAFRLPSVDEVKRLSLVRVLLLVLWLDLVNVVRAGRLRRPRMSAWSVMTTLGGLLSSGNRELEGAVRLVRQRTRIQAEVVLLDRMSHIFHLWHVIHRPFSYAFLTLAIIHVVFMVMLGYY